MGVVRVLRDCRSGMSKGEEGVGRGYIGCVYAGFRAG